MRILFVFILFLFVQLSYGQTELLVKGNEVKITTSDGNQFFGKISDINNETVTLTTESLGDITVSIENISAIESPDLQTSNVPADSKGFPIDYHNSTHYLANPSAYGLKKGQAYYENIGVFFNSFAFGITDNFSVAVGGEIASLLFAEQFPILYVSPKFSLPGKNEKISFSVGGTLFTTPENDFNSFGILQGAVTVGSRNNNFTIGTGFGFNFSDGFAESVFPFYASFMTRLNRKISLVSDNFIIFYEDFDGATSVLSLALRFHMGKNGTAFNAGLFRPTEDIEILAIPFISATIPLGK